MIATAAGQPFLEPQLERYAEDFQHILIRYNELEHCHENLKALHNKLSQEKQSLACPAYLSEGLFLVTGADGHIKYVCDNARVMCMLDESKVVNLRQLMAPFHLTHLEMVLMGMVEGNREFAAGQTEFILYPGGEAARARQFVTSLLPLSDGINAHTCWIMRELIPMKGIGPDPERQLDLYKIAYQGSMALDCRGQIVAVDSVFSNVTGYTNEDVRGQMPFMLKSSAGHLISLNTLAAELKTSGRWQGEVTSIKKNQQLICQFFSVTAVKDDTAQAAAYIVVFSDSALITAAADTGLDAACRDAVTELPGLALFKERTARKIAAASHGSQGVAMLSIGLKCSQWMEDTDHSEMGDIALQTFSTRLLETVRGCDIVTSLAPDRFFVLLAGAIDQAAVAATARKIIQALSIPMVVRNRKLVTGVSVGCALFPSDGEDTTALLDNAHAAMLLARKEGGDRYRLFRERMSLPLIVPPIEGEREFSDALSRQELYLAYQPLVANDDHGQLLACEVQLRWRHAWLGDMVWPERGAAGEVGDSDIDAGVWMLKTACRQLKRWRITDISRMNLVINLTAGQISSHRMAEAVGEMLAETGIDPGQLEFTLSESQNLVILGNDLGNLSKLRALGVQIVLRNFGTGYAGLAQFKSRPFDRLKVERHFVRDAEPENMSGACWEWVVGMGVTTRLDLISIDCGDTHDVDPLTAVGRHLTQGYLKGQPMLPNTFLCWAVDRKRMFRKPKSAGFGL